MKTNYGSLLLRSLMSSSLIMAIVLTSSMVSLAGTAGALSGEITVSGQRVDGNAPTVSLNGENVVTGRTFFDSAVIATPADTAATVNLGKLGRIELSANSNLSLALAENSISGDLASGSIRVFNAEGVAVNIRTGQDTITNDASIAGDVSIDVTSGSAAVSGTEGAVYVNGEPTTQMSKAQKRWVLFGIIGGAVATAVIIYAVTRDEEVTSPVR
jgi:hypothetical protein